MSKSIFNPEYCHVCVHSKYCKHSNHVSIKTNGCVNFKQRKGTVIFE